MSLFDSADMLILDVAHAISSSWRVGGRDGRPWQSECRILLRDTRFFGRRSIDLDAKGGCG